MRGAAVCRGLTGLAALLWILLSCAPVHAEQAVSAPRIYVLDCGQMTIRDMALFSDTGKYDGQSGTVANPCFLIQHPRGMLLWDAGLGDAYFGHDAPPNADGVAIHVEKPLQQQLKELGVALTDVTYLAFSHFHRDHTGNANLFTSATWILNRAELAWATSTPTPPIVDPATLSGYQKAHTLMIQADHDVFGDGLVRILKAPGHTPGHQVLLVKLAKIGPVVLSGDLYHLRSDRPSRSGGDANVMVVNVSRADTLASMDRVEGLIRNLHARLIVQHDPTEYRELPKPPHYLD